jgi:hypothetical protein
MIEKKKSLSLIPKNLVHEKTRLKQFHLAALSSGNIAEAEKLERQLEQLDELAQGNRERGFSRENEMFLRVNERNRKMNMVEMREAERRDAVERRKNGKQRPHSSFSVGGLTGSALDGYGSSGSVFPTTDDPKDILR